LKKSRLKPRKTPVQARSLEMDRYILTAAIRVLKKRGGLNFTTIHVAEEAGISVGSLYQYYPNKEAILFRIQEAEWNDTWPKLDVILNSQEGTPWENMRSAVVAFFESEAEEAVLRSAVDQAGAFFRDTPEYRKLREQVYSTTRRFLRGALPQEKAAQLEFKTDFLVTALTSISESITSRGLRGKELAHWADFTAEWLIQAMKS